ncbi:hypothetical protein FO519_010625, partial [Halicephalobus sp. NKZ332]
MEPKISFVVLLFGFLHFGTSYVVPESAYKDLRQFLRASRSVPTSLQNADYFVIRGNFGYTAYTWLDSLLNLDQLTSVVTSDILQKSQAAQDRARQALPQYSQTVQQAWQQIQQAGQDVLSQRMNSFDLTNTATNIFYSLQPGDRTMFENLFLQVYSY